MGKLDNLGAIVTGAAEGIGEAIAIELASNGAKVACCLLYTSDAADE